MDDNHLGSRYRANLEDEQNSAYLYRILADVEPDERLSEVYGRLAETEEEHLRFWEQKIRDAGERVPERRVGWRTRVLGWLARRFGPQFVLPTIAAQEEADSGHYAAQSETSGTLMPSEERSHARLLRDMSTGSSPGLEGGAIARPEDPRGMRPEARRRRPRPKQRSLRRRRRRGSPTRKPSRSPNRSRNRTANRLQAKGPSRWPPQRTRCGRPTPPSW